MSNLDKAYVHKTNPENVFVTNLRQTLPLKIPQEKYEKLYSLADDTQKRLLQDNYTGPHPGSDGDMDFFALIETNDAIDDSFYTLNDFLEKNDMKSKDMIYYAEMVLNLNHPYYFEHPNDHVPGMMAIEFVRQSLSASIHKFGNVPLTGYHFVLSDLNVRFLNFIEFDAPITVKITLKDFFSHDNQMWTDTIFETRVYQYREIKAEIGVRNSIMSNPGYRRLRSRHLDKLKKKPT